MMTEKQRAAIAAILDTQSERGRKGSLHDIARRIGRSVPTVKSLMQGLIIRGLVIRNGHKATDVTVQPGALRAFRFDDETKTLREM